MSRAHGWSENLQLALFSAHGSDLVAAALGLEGFAGPDRPRQLQLQHRPGAGISALYELPPALQAGFVGLSTERRTGSGDGTVRIEIPAEQARGLAPAVPGARLPAEPLVVTAWRHPHDPRLPGLPLASDPDRVARLWGCGERLERLETVAYRPLRRAVLRAAFATPGPVVDRRSVYLKVLRPGQAASLHARHTLLRAAGLPVPAVLGGPVEDVLALAEAPGEPLSRRILHDGGTSLDPAAFTELLDGLPAAALALEARPAWSERLRRYADAAASALPAAADRIDGLRGRIEAVLRSTDRGPLVPSHGDFYEANLLMDGPRISGLLDVDAVGPGHRVDDLACFLGHLAVLPAVDARYVHAGAGLEHFGAAFGRSVDPRGLWARSAAVAVSLVAGARTPGAPGWEPAALARLAAAEDLLERAG
ncbi:hypothetical protein NCCP1664_02600 [Zafaria cholistanensis]|uniref:Uncharacterized protein n=1 Tax=Zafaria cholistanensis TaxID=1682741 RepID=A0A5A7NLE2_9MICC|nr:phosphotransferase [Zafaria cholistanensis]GER21763.1 hypothetical protein NCCP1664_02600 [Zafaria cholistanensis]